ncbi:pentatricopeptide repeat-containing protein At4g13650 isoform X1 [Cynara cardunculus var. scolymus]|uniref:pentatricopeptide repeat-containing protein At4g13650 isoform X1 n=3 Tax=Cynara cardunculus var. scolymus TaxID=59895 RepID=UPI000D62DF55|nr:pentatricopeptide repeat-containing protein At4g13650 isoform X1 [Cynara cardunculus var. scolymus]XP_024968824.1 pentatricopeptide repeat-containing protein At4g13650 isoform X1 [Cynara cardunculus var. scolymus]
MSVSFRAIFFHLVSSHPHLVLLAGVKEGFSDVHRGNIFHYRQPMILLRGSFSNKPFEPFPRKSATNFPKYFCGKLSELRLAAFSTSASLPVVNEENEGSPKIDETKVVGYSGQICANHQTYCWLLEGYLSSGSLIDAKKLHGRILKSGFDKDYVICSRLADVYVAQGDLNDACQVTDEMPNRDVSFWNNLIFGLIGKKMATMVLGLLTKMLAGNVGPDEVTFANVLRACSGDKVDHNYVKQIHTKIVRHGFGTNYVVCNPLIDLYAKKGHIDTAKYVFQGLGMRDKVSWVAMISGFSQNGHEEESILLFSEMHGSGILPTPYVFSSVISSCTKIAFFKLGEQFHALIHKWGFSSETFVCNALLTLYSRCDNLLSAEQIFSKMDCRDGVSYNTLISGLAQKGLSEKAIQLYEKMQSDNLKPDSVTVASLLSACASVGDFLKGTQLHSYAIKAGVCADIIIEGSLLDLYVKCSDIKTAHEFFLTTEKENVVLWNVMLVAYGQLGDLHESFRIFSQMQIKGLRPNQYTYPSILRTCTLVGALDLGEQIHSQVVKTGFQQNVYVCSVLIDMYSKHGNLDTALKILRRLDEDDVVSWTAMIAGYAQHDLFVEALNTFEEMLQQGIQSDNIGFSSAVSACAGIQAINQGRQIHAQTVTCGYSSDLSIGNALVCLYARCGKVDDAYMVFDKMNSKDNVSWNGLVSGFAQSGYCEEALKVFNRMIGFGVEINMFTYASAVSAAANTTNITQGKQIHGRMIKTGYNMETEASNVLITLYSKCGNLDDAKSEFLEMPDKNEVSWNAMITGYSQHGCGDEAIELFEKMIWYGNKPNYVTFVGVLTACSHVRLVAKGLEYFKSMNEDYGLVPRAEHYACVVDLLGRSGLLSRALEFIKKMPIEPDAMVWRTLLSACTVHKNKEIGEISAGHLLELEPEDSATYVLLSNMYAVSGKWDDRNWTRKLMKDRGVKKVPGRSWIEVKNTVHAFFVGDRLHPLADEIYESLDDLDKRAAEIGYVQDRYSLLNDLEQDQKDPSTCIHSEKLAITFGLLTLSNTIPLRVMKNLRVCNDCHNWIKFVSKISNRSIIVRDSYRFHHFGEGVCSCKDHW